MSEALPAGVRAPVEARKEGRGARTSATASKRYQEERARGEEVLRAISTMFPRGVERRALALERERRERMARGSAPGEEDTVMGLTIS